MIHDVLRLFIRYPLRWFVPALLIAVGAGAYAFLKPPVWEAALSMVVRAEASGNADGAGRFRTLSEMKTLQETLLEIAKSPSALWSALSKVGPPAKRSARGDWPAPQEVEDLRDAMQIVPPKGAEFGSTEVFYLKVKAETPERACALADAVADEMLGGFRRLRDEKAGSMVRELEQAVELAREQRAETVRTLGEFEGRIGGDIGELRNLEQLGSGDGDVRRLTVELESELRQAETAVTNLQQLIVLLEPARQDPSRILATPNRLLESQPALRRLKEGLIDAQLRTSQLLGSMSREHPLVLAAIDSENEVRTRLHAELSAALTGLTSELVPAQNVVHDRRKRLTDVRDRLDRLAAMRAEYSSINAEYLHRTRQLETAEKQLLDARAAQAGASAANLVAKIDAPHVGSKPVGPGKTTLLAMGLFGGLAVGAGLLLLTSAPSGNRPTDSAVTEAWSGRDPYSAEFRRTQTATAAREDEEVGPPVAAV